MKLPVLNVTKFWKWIILAASFIAAKGPTGVELLSRVFGGNERLPQYIHDWSLLVALAAFILTLQVHPTPTDVSATSVTGTTGGGSSSPKGNVSAYRSMPISVPAFAWPAWTTRLVPAMFFAALLGVLAVFGCNNPNAATIVTNDLSGAGACVMADLLSGQVNLANPGTAALQILAQCAGTTATGIVTMIEQLLAAGQGADAGVGAILPASSFAQLPALRDALKALPTGFGHDDAIKALAAQHAH